MKLFVLIPLCVLFAPLQSVFAADTHIVLTGSSTLAPLASEIGERFEAKHPGYRIDVQTGGSSRGIRDAQHGLADIGMSSRALFSQEEDSLDTHQVAMDGVAFVVHKNNPIQNLNKDQLRAIYTNKIKNWKTLTGVDAPITVIHRAKGRSEHKLVTKYFGISSRDIVADSIAGENQQCVKMLLGNPHAIVYLSVGTAEYEIGNGAALKLLSLDGVPASSHTVRNNTFPIVRPLVFVTQRDVSEQLQSFLTYALSAEVNDLITGHAFVPIQ